MNYPPTTPDAARRFAAMREDADELLRTTKRAQKLFLTRRAEAFGTLTDLLEEVLPATPAEEARVARAIQLEPRQLSLLRAGRLDPLRVPPTPLSVLGQSLQIDPDTYWRLISAAHSRFEGIVASRAGGSQEASPEALFRQAWARAARDLPGA